MVSRGEDFPLLCFCSFGWESFVKEGEGRIVGRGGLGKARIRDEGLAEWRGS